MSSESEIEKEIVDKGLTAPRVTPDQIDALMREYLAALNERIDAATNH